MQFDVDLLLNGCQWNCSRKYWEDISFLLEKQKEKRQTKYVSLKDEQIRSSFGRAQQKEELVAILFHGKKHLLLFEFDKISKQNLSGFDFLTNFNFWQFHNIRLHRLVSSQKKHKHRCSNEYDSLTPKPCKVYCRTKNTTAEDYSGLTLLVLCNFKRDAKSKTTVPLYQLV